MALVFAIFIPHWTESRSRLGIAKALVEISPDPVRHIVNTRWHFNHTNGNEWRNSVGAKIASGTISWTLLTIETFTAHRQFLFSIAYPC